MCHHGREIIIEILEIIDFMKVYFRRTVKFTGREIKISHKS